MTSLIFLHKNIRFSLEGCMLCIIPDTRKMLYTGTFLVLLERSLYVDLYLLNGLPLPSKC